MAQERVQRRLAAILAADVVGYSRLMGRDETGTLARLKAHRREFINPTVRAHGGRLVKSAGDGALVEFPSAVEAVTCAVIIQRGMIDRNAALPDDTKIVFRMGINLGDLIIEEDDIYGDGVNVAARLEARAPPGGVLISGAVHDQIRDKLAFAFDDTGEHAVKNIARPVRVYALGPEEIAKLTLENGLAVQAPTPRRRFVIGGAAASAAALVVGTGTWFLWDDSPLSRSPPGELWPIEVGQPASTSAIPERPAPRRSIVVLPFSNLSSDPEQEYLADAITEDLTTDIARIPGIVVIAGQTAHTYKGRPSNLKQVGRDLDVRYALEGSVRPLGSAIRVNAQLLDTVTGAHLWSERFDIDRGRLARLENEVTGRIARALDLELVSAEAQRAGERSTPPEAEDLTLRGLALLNKVPSRETMAEARRLLEEALLRDPQSADAHAYLAQAHLYDWLFRWRTDKEAALATVERHAQAALSLDPRHVRANWVQGTVHDQRRQFDQAIAAFDAAIAANPSFANAYARRSQSKFLTGRPEEAIADVEQAFRLSPHDPNAAVWHWYLGFAKLMLDRPAEALWHFARAVDANRRALVFYPHLASASVLAGRLADGQSIVADYLKLRPGASITMLRRDWNLSDHPRYVAIRDRQLDALREAGLPER